MAFKASNHTGGPWACLNLDHRPQGRAGRPCNLRLPSQAPERRGTGLASAIEGQPRPSHGTAPYFTRASSYCMVSEQGIRPASGFRLRPVRHAHGKKASPGQAAPFDRSTGSRQASSRQAGFAGQVAGSSTIRKSKNYLPL